VNDYTRKLLLFDTHNIHVTFVKSMIVMSRRVVPWRTVSCRVVTLIVVVVVRWMELETE
jgi:hypothetical protein